MVVTKAATVRKDASSTSTKSTLTAGSKASTVSISKTPSNASNNHRSALTFPKSGHGNKNPIQHGKMGQAERAFSTISTLLSGIMAISASQFIGAPLRLIDPKSYHAYMAWTKESFAVLVTTITQWWSPTIVRVSGDASMKDQLFQMEDGSLRCNFPHRLVLMANHQLYTDWMYLWWTAYTNKMHGHIYIILKESLKQLPILGWGAQFYNFIFLSRRWETDKHRFKSALKILNKAKSPMWLLIFPEGTNLSEVTREKSAAWAKKSGIGDMKHQLLPRSTGLQFCLQELKQTTNWLYDCTIAYEGIPPGQYGQDIFTLRSTFLEGRPPKSVNMFWRRFKIADIPLDNNETFTRWLTNRWREKDYILEYFYKFKHFPSEDAMKAIGSVRGKRKPQHAAKISTEVRAGGWEEFLSIFGPLTSAAGALSSVDLTEPINMDTLLSKLTTQQHLQLLGIGTEAISSASQRMVQNALQAAQRFYAIPKPMLNLLIQASPESQDQMKRAIVKSARQTGDAEMARRAEHISKVGRIAPSDDHEVKATNATSCAKSDPTPVLGLDVPISEAGRQGSLRTTRPPNAATLVASIGTAKQLEVRGPAKAGGTKATRSKRPPSVVSGFSSTVLSAAVESKKLPMRKTVDRTAKTSSLPKSTLVKEPMAKAKGLC